MTKDVTLQDLREHFAEHMDEVRQGVTLRLIDGLQVVVEICPTVETVESNALRGMIFREATGSFADFVPPPPIGGDIDVVALLREDRDAR